MAKRTVGVRILGLSVAAVARPSGECLVVFDCDNLSTIFMPQ
jgi:hypothetical protein